MLLECHADGVDVFMCCYFCPLLGGNDNLVVPGEGPEGAVGHDAVLCAKKYLLK